MRAERPIIQAIDAGNDIVAESGCGFTVTPEDPNSIANAALRLMNLTPAQRDEMGRRGRQYVERNHDCRKQAARFAGILCEWQAGASRPGEDSRYARA
jgi:glycosyltransferase involved in cell wall biosynthesis